MEIIRTGRGFKKGSFIDSYGIPCSIQESCAADDARIWLGTEPKTMTVFEDSMGKYIEMTIPKNFMIDTRMHLNREQVAELIPILQKFVDTGEI